MARPGRKSTGALAESALRAQAGRLGEPQVELSSLAKGQAPSRSWTKPQAEASQGPPLPVPVSLSESESLRIAPGEGGGSLQLYYHD